MVRLTRVATFALFLGVAITLALRFGIGLRGPHVVLPAGPPLDDEKRRELDAELAALPAPLASRDDVQRFALDFTARSLRFSLEHPASYRFTRVPRDGSCVEYAYLFARVFDRASERAGLRARAYRIRSTDARLFGAKVPLRGFGDHDWALVVDGAERAYVDPTLYDAHLGWNVAWNVADRAALRAP